MMSLMVKAARGNVTAIRTNVSFSNLLLDCSKRMTANVDVPRFHVLRS